MIVIIYDFSCQAGSYVTMRLIIAFHIFVFLGALKIVQSFHDCEIVFQMVKDILVSCPIGNSSGGKCQLIAHNYQYSNTLELKGSQISAFCKSNINTNVYRSSTARHSSESNSPHLQVRNITVNLELSRSLVILDQHTWSKPSILCKSWINFNTCYSVYIENTKSQAALNLSHGQALICIGR